MTVEMLHMVDTPAVVVDIQRLQTNVADMAAFAAGAGVALRPHFKTHKMIPILRLQEKAGIKGVTVSKLDEAETVIGAGFTDVLVAYPVVGPRKVARLVQLAKRADLTVAVDTPDAAAQLSTAMATEGLELKVLVEVDSGLKRCGTPPGSPTVDLAEFIHCLPGLRLVGLMTHAGHAYAAGSPDKVRLIGLAEGKQLVDTADQVRAAGLPCPVVSVGSTPTARTAGRVAGVTEIRPGNYVFNDAIQISLGVASLEQCALLVISTVISRPHPDRLVIDAGSKTLALDRGAHGNALIAGYGLLVGYPHLVLARLSEEHGVVEVRGEGPLPAIGERVQVIPNHACPVVNLADRVAVVRGEEVLEWWRVDARGGVR